MEYKFLAIGDIHWGAMDSLKMYNNLSYFIDFIKSMKDEIDLLVICGDYFDYRIQLSSKTAIRAVTWFDEMVDACKYANVKKIRVIKGTKDHDNDQLEVFRPPYENEDEFIKIFNTSVVEETLPGLKIYYGPDEPMNNSEYSELYSDLLLEYADIGFFHGNFDTILPSIEVDRITNNKISTMIYEYQRFSSFIRGPLISAHWHIKNQHEALYYIGSYDRWKFGEEEDKGFIYGSYDTDDNGYIIDRVVNPYADDYISISCPSDLYYTPEHFADIEDSIINLSKKDPNVKIRVTYIIVNDSSEGALNFGLLQKRFAGYSNVKLINKDLVKRALKKQKKETVLFEASKYGYIFDDPKNYTENISKFILDKKGIYISPETIGKYISKYLDKD